MTYFKDLIVHRIYEANELFIDILVHILILHIRRLYIAFHILYDIRFLYIGIKIRQSINTHSLAAFGLLKFKVLVE